MNPLLVTLAVTLRSTALTMMVLGRGKLSDELYTLADLVVAGSVTEEHMRAIAEKLKSRSLTGGDFEDVIARISVARERLHA